MRTILVTLTLLAVSIACAQEARVVEALSNPGFEEGLSGWGTWPSDSTTTVTADTEVAHSGRGSVRLDATSPSARMFVLQTSPVPQPNRLYRISVWIRKDRTVPDHAVGFLVNYRKAEGGVIVQRADPWDIHKQAEGEWVRWSGVFYTQLADVHWQVLLRLEYAVGRVWFDDVQVEDLGETGQLTPDMWSYIPLGVEIGSGPAGRFAKHRQANDAAYQMAGRYNGLMMREGVAEARSRETERVLNYAQAPAPPMLRERFEAAEHALNACYLAFARAFRSGQDGDREAFEASAAQAEQAIAALETAAEQARQSVARTPERLPQHLGQQSRDIPPFDQKLRMNRLLIGVWSPMDWSEFERPFDFEFHSGWNTGLPTEYDGISADFSNITQQCDEMIARGYRGTFSMLPFGQHDVIWAPKWFMDRHADDPDIRKVSWDGCIGRDDGKFFGLNYYHPAVREHISTYLPMIARFLKDEPRVLFYETSQEAYPYFGCEKGRRETGYGASATADFHAWLLREYGDIATLNRAWGTNYPGFDAIQQPPDRYAVPDREITPLVAEFERWREDAYIDYLKLIYDAIKRGDTTKPVAARHSSLLRAINGARIFETCDVLSFHTRAPMMQLGTVYVNTLARINDRPLGYLEDFWGCQQESNRISDERAQRRGLEKHVCRQFAWGRTLQMKWYAYTTGSYLTQYNGNWFDPRYDVLTMRYCAPGLKVALDRMRNLDWVLTHSRIPAFRLCVWQPSASMRIQGREELSVGEMLSLHQLIYPAGFPYELVPEEYFADGRESLDNYDVVILPCAEYLSEEHQRRLADWVRAGGTLIAIEPPGVKDELTRPSGLLLRDIYGVGRAEFDPQSAVWSYQLPGAELVAPAQLQGVRAGKGLACLTPTVLLRALEGDEGEAAFLDLLRQRVKRTTWAEGARLEVVMRVTEEGDRYLFVLNPDPDLSASDTVLVDQPVEYAVDVSVPGGYPVPVKKREGRAALDMTLGPCEMAVVWLGSQ